MQLPSFFLSSFHYSYLLIFTITYLLGQMCAARGWFCSSPFWLCGFGLLTSFVGLLGGRRAVIVTIYVLAMFVLANLSLQRTLYPHFPPHHLRQLFLPQQVIVEGVLFREPEHFLHRGRLYLETLRIWQDGEERPATGKVLLTVRSLVDRWHYGDILRIPLALREPRNFHNPSSFDYEGYLARQEIYLSAFLWDDTVIEHVGFTGNYVRRQLEQFRRTVGAFFDAHLDDQTAAVLRALIIGDEGLIRKDLREAFSRAGVAHILSISGLHISLVAAAAYSFWWWLLSRSRLLLLALPMPKLASFLALPLVLFYAGLAGGSIATWRSVIMVFAYLFASLIDRQGEIYRSLAFAALLISFLWPGAVLDISFQLSFLSVFSIFLGTEIFFPWWKKFSECHSLHLFPKRERIFRWGATYVVVSVCALLGTAPLTAVHFNQVALAGVLANFLIVPLLGSAAVILGLLAVGFIFLNSTLATVLLFCADIVTQVGIWLVEWFASLPYVTLHSVTPTLLELSLLYGFLFSLVVHSIFSKQSSLVRFLPYVLLGLLLADCTFWIWSRCFHQDLRVTFLDVGQGDAAVVELPGSQVMVIDGGGFASEDFDTGEAIIAPFLWSRKISQVDILVMSHPQLDHYGGLVYLAEHFFPRELWSNGEQAQSGRFSHFKTVLTKRGVTFRTLCRETSELQLSSIHVQVLHPPCQRTELDTNNASLVLRLTHGRIDFLFTGDIEATGENLLLATGSPLSSKILKVPHHGSRTSSTVAFVNAVDPQVAIASLGYRNRFHFPAREVILRYKKQGSSLFRTDQVGAVTVISNGDKYKTYSYLPLL